MKKGILTIWGLILLGLNSWGQSEQNDSVQTSNSQLILSATTPIASGYFFTDGYDRLIKLNKDTLVVKIQKITQTEVVFKYPLNTIINRIPVYHVKEIIAKDVAITTTFKTLSGPAKKILKDTIPVTDIKSVIVTFEESDVAGLTELGPVESHSEGESATTSTSLMEKNAIFQLRKKAAQMGATKVLVTEKNTETPYGENPLVEMKGIAYK
jgi:hypothetical protein